MTGQARVGRNEAAAPSAHDGVPEEVAIGLAAVRLPVPFPPWHVNAWLMADGEGWTVIDSGKDDADTRLVWEHVFARHLTGRPVTRVIVTHGHLDHVGLAGWLCARFGAPLWMARTEWLQTRQALDEPPPRSLAQQQDFHRAAGCPTPFLDYLTGADSLYRRSVAALPPSFVRIADGEVVRVGATDWRAIAAPGHAPEQICLFDPERRILIAADHILETISPYIGVVAAEPDGDPLGDYLAALARFRSLLPADTLVLPSHGKPFRGLHRRIDDLIRRHGLRLDQIAELCTKPRTAFQVAESLFRLAPDHSRTKLAVGETLSHLNRLIRQGRLRRSGDGQRAPLIYSTC